VKNEKFDEGDMERNEDDIQNANLVQSTLEDITQKLYIKENVVDLVLVTMVQLPDEMPSTFIGAYKPISAAGTQMQIKQLAKLIASQLLIAGCIQGSDKLDSELFLLTEPKIEDEIKIDDTFYDSKKSQNNASLTYETIKKKQMLTLQPKKQSKTYKLSDVTKRLSKNQIESMLSDTYKRIQDTEGAELLQNV
jgi:symplekin